MILTYTNFINEMTIKKSELNKLNFYLNKDFKSDNTNWLDKNILKFREDIKNIQLKDIKLIFKYGESKSELRYYFYFDNSIINKYKELIENGKLSDSIYRFYFNEYNFITIEQHYLNKIHFINDLPYVFRGCKLGFKLYLKIIFEIGYISSFKSVSDDAKRIWKYLIQNKSLYHILYTDIYGTKKSIVVNKNISDINFTKFKKEFGTFRDKDIISIDKELENKINNYDIKI